MKALVYLGPRRMELQDLPDPSPAPNEARVRVRAAAICGSDLHGFRGRCREGQPNLCPHRRLMGMDFPGAFADAFTIEAGQLIPVPEGMSDEIGSLTEPLANAVHVVERSVRARNDVLVIGAGPIGLFAARVAILAGAARTFVVDRLDDRLALAAALGAEPVHADDAGEVIDGATRSAGVDTVIDAAGFASTWALAIQAARRGGRIEAVGLGAVEGPISYRTVVAKGLTIVGSYACLERDFTRALTLLSAGDVDVGGWIATMPLADGRSAFEALVDGSSYTKIVLTP